MAKVYGEAEYFAEQLAMRIIRALAMPVEERPLFVVVEQVGEGYSDRRIELRGPWPADQFDLDWVPGFIRGPLGEIDDELVAGFFEIYPETIGQTEGVAYTQEWPQMPEEIGRQATPEEIERATG